MLEEMKNKYEAIPDAEKTAPHKQPLFCNGCGPNV